MPLHPGVKFGESSGAEWLWTPHGAGKTFANYLSLQEIDYFNFLLLPRVNMRPYCHSASFSPFTRLLKSL